MSIIASGSIYWSATVYGYYYRPSLGAYSTSPITTLNVEWTVELNNRDRYILGAARLNHVSRDRWVSPQYSISSSTAPSEPARTAYLTFDITIRPQVTQQQFSVADQNARSEAFAHQYGLTVGVTPTMSPMGVGASATGSGTSGGSNTATYGDTQTTTTGITAVNAESAYLRRVIVHGMRYQGGRRHSLVRNRMRDVPLDWKLPTVVEGQPCVAYIELRDEQWDWDIIDRLEPRELTRRPVRQQPAPAPVCCVPQCAVPR